MQAGSGLLIIESTAISKEGMISKKDLSLRNEKNFKEFKSLFNYLKKISNTKIGINYHTLEERVLQNYHGKNQIIHFLQKMDGKLLRPVKLNVINIGLILERPL